MSQVANNDLSYEDITPAKALQYLATSPGNRTYTKQNIAVYIEEMRKNLWFAGNDALIFDVKDRLRNGHHRLQAVIQSGKTVRFIVRRNVPEHEVIVFDTGKPRNLVDATAFDDTLGGISKDDVQIANSMLTEGYRKRFRKFSNQELASFITVHRDEIDFAKSCFPKKAQRITLAPVYAVFARAAYQKAFRPNLMLAGNILINGLLQDEKDRVKGVTTLGKLRDYLLLTSASSGKARVELYSKTENMLKLFLDGVDRAKVTASKEELFPIDEFKFANYTGSSVVDCSLISKISQIAEGMSNMQIVTPLELAQKLIALGYKRGNSDNQEKTISRYVASLIKATDKFEIPEIGYFEPYSENVGRIKKYVFNKHNRETNMLASLRKIA